MKLRCDLEQLGMLMIAVCQMGRFVRRVTGEAAKDPSEQTLYEIPTPLEELSFEAPSAGEVRLILDLGLRISVPVDRDRLKALASELSRVAHALSADDSKRN